MIFTSFRYHLSGVCEPHPVFALSFTRGWELLPKQLFGSERRNRCRQRRKDFVLWEVSKRGMAMVSPFDLKTALLAKHAQHVVLIHFPIALFITAVAFDFLAQWTKRRGLADAAYYDLLVAAIATVPVLATGLLAWQFQLEGQKLKGILLLHLILACVSTVMIWLVWWVHLRARRRAVNLPSYLLVFEFLVVGLVALTGHLGGYLSGVNLTS
jgi:uncharacterized membrane protein